MAAASREFRLNYHLAGLDGELRRVVPEVQLGRWRDMRALLAATGGKWALRTTRTQVLAVAARESGAVEAWLQDAPCYDAHVMRARVLAERVVHSHRSRSVPDTRQANTPADRVHTAMEAEVRTLAGWAAVRKPMDPVPWLCLLRLALADPFQQRPEHRIGVKGDMLPEGPWGLLKAVRDRDDVNREAFHSVLAFIQRSKRLRSPAYGVDFARSAVSLAPYGSPLLLLPLYAEIERLRRQPSPIPSDPLNRGAWTKEPLKDDTATAYESWFAVAPAEERSVSDLSYLAWGLWAGNQHVRAAQVFIAMEEFAARQPWTALAQADGRGQTGETLFCQARAKSLAYADRHPSEPGRGTGPGLPAPAPPAPTGADVGPRDGP
ncbi:hypothetical protein [Streptomyces sp. NPDC059994]|uniref:hypothetical protein n=1 Tax=Streptomyces sp. NPDC059994 TaxID=3347029 RepID=UPI0036BD05A5